MSISRPRPTAERVPPHRPAVDGSLALSAQPASQPPLGPPAAPGPPTTPELRLVKQPTGPHGDVQVWAARFAQAVIEVLGGDRPLSQLLRWTSQRVYAELEQRLALLARRGPAAASRTRAVRPQVRSVHVYHPSPGSAEISVHVRYGQRSRAIAARLEHDRGRWQCTVLQLG